MIAEASPHTGHFAVAELETMYENFLLVTQNIDNLHREAGSRSIVEFHGNIFRNKCFDQGHSVDKLPQTDDPPPRCECGSLIRPDVVWFGEIPAHEDFERSASALESCEAILVIGTSGMVYPAAGFPAMAKRAGAKVVEVNPEQTPITLFADVFIKAPAGEALPAIVERIKKTRAY
jgi:NAD-dependent deacetylase